MNFLCTISILLLLVKYSLFRTTLLHYNLGLTNVLYNIIIESRFKFFKLFYYFKALLNFFNQIWYMHRNIRIYIYIYIYIINHTKFIKASWRFILSYLVTFHKKKKVKYNLINVGTVSPFSRLQINTVFTEGVLICTLENGLAARNISYFIEFLFL